MSAEGPIPEGEAGMLEQLLAVNERLNQRFPNGRDPFQILARLMEECGELAEQVNHFEGSGVKAEKHGAPDRAKLAKEVQDVLRCALQIAEYYGIEDQLRESVALSHRGVRAESATGSGAS